MTDLRPTLHVCVTCKAGLATIEGEPTAGQRLFDAVSALGSDAVEIREVRCLSACKNGAAAALTAPGRWGYLLGRIGTEHAAELLQFGATYAASADGAVKKPQRPPALVGAVLGRVPALEHGA